MAESPVVRKILLALSSIGCRGFRNNVGVLQDKHGQRVKYGLHVGSSDVIGWTPVVITADMVGSRVAVFTAIEAKDETNPTEEQRQFLKAVSDAGGIALVVRKEGAIPAAMEIIRTWRGSPVL